MTALLIFILRLYKKIFSPILEALFGNACRFTPTCSQYTIDALSKYGALKGLFMGIKRVGKCHPFGGFGYDPVE
jgi:putative membrane protein insertion efficiency factor